MDSKHQKISEALNLIADLIEQADKVLGEEIQLHRRDVFSRLERRVREKGTPLTRDVLRARRERKARSRYQTLKNVLPPRKMLSTRFRKR
jgi:hypothetical protein